MFWFQPVWGLRACGQHVGTILHLGGVLVSAEQLKDTCHIVMYIPRGGTRTLFYHWTIVITIFLTVITFPLFLSYLISLNSNCLSLLREGLEEEETIFFPYKQETWAREGLLSPVWPHRVLLGFIIPISRQSCLLRWHHYFFYKRQVTLCTVEFLGPSSPRGYITDSVGREEVGVWPEKEQRERQSSSKFHLEPSMFAPHYTQGLPQLRQNF